ncbi:aldo/keto reductase [Amnibacterium flavum]|nr:aldo/keto reductase [Amnibacterium flavum]
MRMLPLGRSGIDVSEFLFGAGGIGGVGSSRTAIGKGLTLDQGLSRLDEAWERGIRVIDTADSYAAGDSEKAVGRWLGEREPDGAIVATKVGAPIEHWEDRVDLSPKHIERQLTVSIRRLGRVDLYLSHAPDPQVPLAATMSAFAEAIGERRIRAWGCSNVTVRDLEALLSVADSEGLPRPEWVQNGFNLALRGDERDLLPLVAAEGLGYTPYSPLAGGVLSERYLKGAEVVPGSRIDVARAFYADFLTDAALARVQLLADLARDLDVSTAGLALAWLRRHPDVTAPIISPRTEAQWQAVDEALELDLGEEEFEAAGALFPS